jgi:DNA-binding FadR family transcriptional regulator
MTGQEKPTLPPAVDPRASDRIVRDVLARLREGALKPGDRLPTEQQLGAASGASRTVVREALQQLKAMGVVRARVGSGSYIADGGLEHLSDSLALYSDRADSPADWTELLELRLLIETESARRLAGAGTPADFAPVRDALESMRRSTADLRAFAEADVAFHQAIVAASGNRLFAGVHRAVLPMTRRFARATYRSLDQITANLREHQEIFDALLAHDQDTAASRMHAHLQSSARQLLRMLGAANPVQGNTSVDSTR